MTSLDQFFALITPVAIVTAVVSGIAFGVVVHAMRPDTDVRLATYLAVVLGAIWYIPQATQLLLVEGTGFGTLGRMSLFLVGFVVPMAGTLAILQRRSR